MIPENWVVGASTYILVTAFYHQWKVRLVSVSGRAVKAPSTIYSSQEEAIAAGRELWGLDVPLTDIFHCLHCGKRNHQEFFLKREVWGLLLHNQAGRIHLQCFEERLSRALTLDDFNPETGVNATLFHLYGKGAPVPEIPADMQEMMKAWKEASASGSFYAEFEKTTGFTEAQVKKHFTAWNALTHAMAEEIAEENGVSVREGGFQAYLADIKRIGRPRLITYLDHEDEDPNPRPNKPWPAAEDCPGCDGRAGPEYPHRFGCSAHGARQIKIPVDRSSW